MALQAALAVFRVGQHDVLTKLVANYEGKSLDLSSQKLGAFGASAVAKGLQANKVLQTLEIARNNIGDQGAAAFADALKVNTTVQTLNIGSNNLGHKGAALIAEAIKIIHGPNISGYLPRSREMKPLGSQHDISKSHSNESRFGPDIMGSRWHRVARLVTGAQHTPKSARVSPADQIRRLPEIIHGPNISGYLPRSREMKPFGSQHDISKSHSNESRFGPDIMGSRWHRVARLVTGAQHTSKSGGVWSILAQLAEVGTHWTRGNRVSILLRLPEIIHGPNISGYLPRSREMKPFGSQHDISKSHSNESRFGPDIMGSRWHRVARLVTGAQHTSKSDVGTALSTDSCNHSSSSGHTVALKLLTKSSFRPSRKIDNTTFGISSITKSKEVVVKKKKILSCKAHLGGCHRHNVVTTMGGLFITVLDIRRNNIGADGAVALFYMVNPILKQLYGVELKNHIQGLPEGVSDNERILEYLRKQCKIKETTATKKNEEKTKPQVLSSAQQEARAMLQEPAVQKRLKKPQVLSSAQQEARVMLQEPAVQKRLKKLKEEKTRPRSYHAFLSHMETQAAKDCMLLHKQLPLEHGLSVWYIKAESTRRLDTVGMMEAVAHSVCLL
eukprot:g3333.t1